MIAPKTDFIDVLMYAAYTALGILPAAIQIKEDLKWKRLK